MIRLGLQPWTGSLLSLGVGCWMAFGAKVFFRCPGCEGLCLLGQVAANGGVEFGNWDGPLFLCQTPTCGYARGIRFEQWAPPQPFDLGGPS